MNPGLLFPMWINHSTMSSISHILNKKIGNWKCTDQISNANYKTLDTHIKRASNPQILAAAAGHRN